MLGGKVEDGAVIDVIRHRRVDVPRIPAQLLLTTVNASGVPGYPIINAQAVWGMGEPAGGGHAAGGDGAGGAERRTSIRRRSNKDMAGSQASASAVGIRRMPKPTRIELGIDAAVASPHAKVTMHVDSIGGPSAGMMYTLGLIDKLTPASESGGKTIAGTGTIRQGGQCRQNRRH